jgi:hypothetical protein
MEDPYPGATRILFISCPLCGMQRPLNKKGSVATAKGKKLEKGVKGIQHFNRVNLDKHTVVRECACLGYGKGKGFQKVKGLTLEQIKDEPAFAWVKAELEDQCREILALLGSEE